MIIALLFFRDWPLRKRIHDIFLAITVAIFPLLLWMFRNIMVAQSATNRIFTIHPIDFSHIRSLFGTIYYFTFPISIPLSAKILYFCVITVLSIVGMAILRKTKYISNNANSTVITLPAICTSFLFNYIFFLIISICFFDAHIPLDYRLLLPALLVLILNISSLCYSLSVSN